MVRLSTMMDFSVALRVVALLCSSQLYMCAATNPEARDTQLIDPCLPVAGSVTNENSFLATVSDDFSHCASGTWEPNGTNAFRVWSYSDPSDGYPLVIVARQEDAVVSWTVPFSPQGFEFPFNEADRTLCPITPLTINQTTPVYIDLFTNSPSPVNYNISVEPVPNYELSFDKTQSVTIGATTPQIHYFSFPSDSDVVTIEAESTNMKCAIISVQNNSCPANDLLKNARSIGLFQTMSTSAFLTVRANQVENREFLLVMITTNYSVCHKGDFVNLQPLGPGENGTLNPVSGSDPAFQQTMNITIRNEKPARKYIGALLGPPFIFIGVGIVVLLLTLVSCYVPQCLWTPWCKCIKIGNYQEEKAINQGGERTPLIQSQEREPQTVQNSAEACPLQEEEKNLTLHQMLKKDHQTLESQYALYGWNTITVGIFYGLPAFQLVLAQQQLVYSSGNQDQCFYNFKCARPAGVFSAFNNVWSNIGFIVLGIFFIIIVGIRHVQYRIKKRKDQQYLESHGIPQFFGIYYAMGVAMIIEGFMSSFYHTCPRNANFQFDTAFMFIIGGLLLAKLFQNRHPEVHASSVIAFFTLSVVIFFTLLGIWFDMRNPVAVRFVLFFIAIVAVVLFLVSFYHYHNWKFCFKSTNKCHKCRFWKFLLAAVMNLTIVVLGIALFKYLDFPTVVLILFLSNFGYFLLWYIILKLYYKEPWTITPLILPILFGVLWILALKYYFSNVSDWQVTPAESRRLNKNCILFDFYDNHDMWHFLATSAIFATFMFILTIDDGLAHKSRKKIHVF